jgi:hypothetical protein
MRKFLIAVPVVASLMGSCTSTPTDVASVVAQVQQAAIVACGFLPTAATVAAILSGGASTAVTDIAQLICTAVTTKGVRRGAAPTVNGVVIHGRFVR